MLVKTKAIVISALRYQDKSLIVKCFTESDGLKSYFIRDAFTPGKNRQKAAYFQPLNILEIEALHKNKGKLEYFREVKLAMPFRSISSDIKKTTIAIFISEVLHHAVKEEEKNSGLYSFLESSFLWLDNHDEIVNFHLVLLLEMTKFLGFYPDAAQKGLPYFEMTEGIFIPYETTSCLTASETGLFRKLINTQFDTGNTFFTGSERQALLKILLDYYAFHQEGFIRPRSADVLREVFS